MGDLTPSPALSLLASAESSGWFDSRGPTRCLESPGRAGVSPQAKGRACRAPWAEVGRGRSEPCWGRFRRLCNLTQPARPRGSDERRALLPKLISRAPPSPSSFALLPLLLRLPRGRGWGLFIYAKSPGVGGVVCGARRPPSPCPELPVPFEVTLGVIYRRGGGVEWSGVCAPLPLLRFTLKTRGVFLKVIGIRHHSIPLS